MHMSLCRPHIHRISLRSLFRFPYTIHYDISYELHLHHLKFSTDTQSTIDIFSSVHSDSTNNTFSNSIFKTTGFRKNFSAIGDTDQNSLNASLNNVKSALDSGDIITAWNLYSTMEKHNFLDLLSTSQLENLSKLMTTQCVDLIRLRLGAISPQEMSVLEEFLLSFALRGFESGLCAVMLGYVRRNRPEDALSLYWKYVGRLKRSVVMPESSAAEFEEMEEEEHMSVPSLSMTSNTDHVQSNAMAIAIAAHASRNAWEDAMHTMIDHPTRFTYYTTRQLRKMLDYDPQLRSKSFDYLYDLNLLRLALSPESLNRHILNLTRDNATSQFQKLYTSIVNALSGPKAWLSVNEKKLTHSTPVYVSEKTLGWVLTACINLRLEPLAQKLWDILQSINAPLHIISYTSLIEGYRTIGDIEGLTRTWDSMLHNNIKPSYIAYRAKISALFEARRKDLALSTFASYQKAFKREQQVVMVFNTVLHGLLIHSDYARARAIFEDMLVNGPEPDVVTYNSFLRFHGRKGDLKAVADVVQELAGRGAHPDVVTFTTIISTLLKAGRADAVEKLLVIMKSMGVEENVATYSAIIDHQVREKTEESLRVAWDLLAKMEQLSDAQPNEVTYTTLLAGLHRNPDISTQNLSFMLNDITHRMAQRGVKPNQVTYNILLKACLENPKPIGLRSAMSYYREMQSREIVMSKDTWFVLLKGLVNRREWGIARELVGHMGRMGFEPPPRIRELVGQIEVGYRAAGQRRDLDSGLR